VQCLVLSAWEGFVREFTRLRVYFFSNWVIFVENTFIIRTTLHEGGVEYEKGLKKLWNTRGGQGGLPVLQGSIDPIYP
jgi:hypothetical protein